MRKALILCSAMLIGAAGRGPIDGAPSPAIEPTVRIGVYDNRAIAVAFGGSRFNPVHEKLEARRLAAERGDEAKLAELNAWGESFQRRLHFQGFGRYPVDDLLAHVEADLPALAERLDLDAITWYCDYRSPGVETVDITAELVALFEPGEQALEWTTQIRDQEFVDLDTLVNMSPED